MRFFHYWSDKQLHIGLEWQNKLIDASKMFLNYKSESGLEYSIGETLDGLIQRGLTDQQMMEKIENILENYPLEYTLSEDSFNYELPFLFPQRVLAIGRNYADHAAELGNPVPDKLLFFEKSISCLTPHNSPVVIPKWVDGRVDHEAELALILNKGGKNIPVDAAPNHVAGYSIFNDITARDLQKQDKKAGRPWVKSKSIDTFGPMGPFFVPACKVPDPHNLEIEFKINGEVHQKGNTRDMIYRIPDLVSILSGYLTLLPGDIIITGTPAGVSPLNHGDLMEASITGLGTLRNKVVRE